MLLSVFFQYRCGWGLSLESILLIFLLLGLIILVIIKKIHSFLAINKPVNAEILVVEGWMSSDALKEALKEFEAGKYSRLITTGGELKRESFVSVYKNYAELAAATLNKLGCPNEKIMIVPTPKVEIGRTIAAVKEVKKKLLELPEPPLGVNIYSFDVHTRRSWLVFKRIFRPELVQIGALSYRSKSYPIETWWKTSEGAKVILTEIIAYIYTLFNRL